jgi:starch synthase
MTRQKKVIKNVWMLSREYGDIAGVGGVKDVVSQLAEALARWNGRSVQVVLPLYGFVRAEELGFTPLADPACPSRELRLQIDMHQPEQAVREEVGYFYQRRNRVNLYLVDAERFRQKSAVYTYSREDEKRVWWQKQAMGHHDYFAMNLLLQKAALELMLALGETPEVVHCHDGHTAVLAAMIRENGGYRSFFRRTCCLVTIHNAGHGYHQEIADIPYACSITGLPTHVVDNNQLDRKFNPFLVAGQYGLLNTVSENYARELQETDSDRLTGWLGHELRRRGVVLAGVTNGIEPEQFSPATLEPPEHRFDPASAAAELAGKKRCREALLRQLAAPGEIPEAERFGTLDLATDGPLFTFIGRLSEQKGVDTLLAAVPTLFASDLRAQLLVLGNGSAEFEARLIGLAEEDEWRGRLCFLRGFHSQLADRVFAAGDFFLIPSRYEPCGLTDFIAQLYGNIPVVHGVGGLVKVVDGDTGIVYQGEGVDGLLQALARALELFQLPEQRRQIQRQAVAEIHRRYTWNKVMQQYLDLYRRAWHGQVCAEE